MVRMVAGEIVTILPMVPMMSMVSMVSIGEAAAYGYSSGVSG